MKSLEHITRLELIKSIGQYTPTKQFLNRLMTLIYNIIHS